MPKTHTHSIETEYVVLCRVLQVRCVDATKALVDAVDGGKVGGLTYIKNLTAQMGHS
jgi:mTERF domain-containing protein, mitochondrial